MIPCLVLGHLPEVVEGAGAEHHLQPPTILEYTRPYLKTKYMPVLYGQFNIKKHFLFK